MRALATLALKTVSCDLHHITSATDFTVSQSGRLSDGSISILPHSEATHRG